MLVLWLHGFNTVLTLIAVCHYNVLKDSISNTPQALWKWLAKLLWQDTRCYIWDLGTDFILFLSGNISENFSHPEYYSIQHIPLPMTGCHTDIYKRQVSLHMSPGVSSWSMRGKSRISLLGVKSVLCSGRACLCLVRKSRSFVYKHSRAETARGWKERSIKWSKNEIERGKRKAWKTESCFISD